MNENYHAMVLEKTHVNGVEEWCCPTCGRRFLVQWPPDFKMMIIDPGEKDTRHTVSKSNSRPDPSQITHLEITDFIDGYRLIPWLKWMEKADFDGMWGTSA